MLTLIHTELVLLYRCNKEGTEDFEGKYFKLSFKDKDGLKYLIIDAYKADDMAMEIIAEVEGHKG